MSAWHTLTAVLVNSRARGTREEAERLAQSILDKHAHELAAKIQDAMEEARAADWGKSSRSKRPYLQGMERARRALLEKEVKSG